MTYKPSTRLVWILAIIIVLWWVQALASITDTAEMQIKKSPIAQENTKNNEAENTVLKTIELQQKTHGFLQKTRQDYRNFTQKPFFQPDKITPA